MPERNAAKTVKFQISLDEVSNQLLQKMSVIGIFGKNRVEVNAWIIHEWIWHNQENLERLGISLRPTILNPEKKS
jgi:hypothetical protein